MKNGKTSLEGLKSGIYSLRKQRQMLETYLLSTRSQMPVWISSQYTYCKKGNCKCTQGHPHGPFHYLFFKAGGKVQHRYIPKKKLKQIQELISTYKSYQERMAVWNKVHKQLDMLFRKHQKENLVSVPAWIQKKKR